MQPYEPHLIAPFKSGLVTDVEPWLLPEDAFSEIINAQIYESYVEKRKGYTKLAQFQVDRGAGPQNSNNRIMGISNFIDEQNVKTTVAFDTENAAYLSGSTFQPLDSSAVMASTKYDFVETTQWQISGSDNRLFFTNGRRWDGSLDGIRYWDGTATTTTSFVRDLDPTSTRKLYGAKFIFTLRGRLIVLATYELDGVVRYHPQRLRWCQYYEPDGTGWDDITPGRGGFVDAPTAQHIVSARQLEDAIIVLFTDSVWIIRPVSDPALPFRWDRLNSIRACGGKAASTGYDRFVFSIGNRGIVGSSVSSVERLDKKISSYVEDNIDSEQQGLIFIERDYQNLRTISLYSSAFTESVENDTALVFNDETSSWSTWDIDMNVLGHGATSEDLAFQDFTASNDKDWVFLAEDPSDEDAGDDTWDSYYIGENEEILLGGNITGEVFRLGQGNTDDGAEIQMSLTSAKWNPYKERGQQAQFGFFDLRVDCDAETHLKISFYTNNQVTPYDEVTIDLLPPKDFIAAVQSVDKATDTINAAGHGIGVNETVWMYGSQGMVQINGFPLNVTAVTENTITVDLDLSSFDDYLGGGKLYRTDVENVQCWKRVYCGAVATDHQVKIESVGNSNPVRIHGFLPYFRPVGRRLIK